jgi:hypothetical protein
LNLTGQTPGKNINISKTFDLMKHLIFCAKIDIFAKVEMFAKDFKQES